MNIQTALKEVNEKFVYEKDGSVDVWEILDTDGAKIKGDCEDYSLTLIWLTEDQNFFKFIWSILIAKYVLWYAKTPNGGGHAITYVRKENLYVDNILKGLYTKEQYEKVGFRFYFPFISILTILKLSFSYTVGRFLK
jgi:predicted transglutaminase-like cysteine proteinase